MEIKQLKKELNISNKDIAEYFQLTPGAYANSTAKKRYEAGICKLYEHIKNKRDIK